MLAERHLIRLILSAFPFAIRSENGDAIKSLRAAGHLVPSAARSLEAFWAIANTEHGLRHGAHTPESITDVEAQYLIDSAEAAIQLLVRLDRAQVAGSD